MVFLVRILEQKMFQKKSYPQNRCFCLYVQYLNIKNKGISFIWSVGRICEMYFFGSLMISSKNRDGHPESKNQGLGVAQAFAG